MGSGERKTGRNQIKKWNERYENVACSVGNYIRSERRSKGETKTENKQGM